MTLFDRRLSVAIGREADMQTVEWGNCIGAIDPDQITHPVAAIDRSALWV
jgi:hypothetical protein